VAVACWLTILVAGLWGLVTLRGLDRFRWALGLTLLGQVGLHLVYGDETFLYSLHFLPLLLALAACATQLPARQPLRLVLLLLIVLVALNNTQQFQRAVEFMRAHG
jgi:hypothetical protein